VVVVDLSQSIGSAPPYIPEERGERRRRMMSSSSNGRRSRSTDVSSTGLAWMKILGVVVVVRG